MPRTLKKKMTLRTAADVKTLRDFAREAYARSIAKTLKRA